MTAEAQLAHVSRLAHGAAGRTVITVTLTGGDAARREALADQVIAAARDALAPAPASNHLAAVFARLSRPAPSPAGPRPTELLRAGTVLQAAPHPPATSPYEAPFVLAPLTRRPR